MELQIVLGILGASSVGSAFIHALKGPLDQIPDLRMFVHLPGVLMAGGDGRPVTRRPAAPQRLSDRRPPSLADALPARVHRSRAPRFGSCPVECQYLGLRGSAAEPVDGVGHPGG